MTDRLHVQHMGNTYKKSNVLEIKLSPSPVPFLKKKKIPWRVTVVAFKSTGLSEVDSVFYSQHKLHNLSHLSFIPHCPNVID